MHGIDNAFVDRIVKELRTVMASTCLGTSRPSFFANSAASNY
ncbi:hypothetical protein X743_33515 [Mesorhizobium sp. LNHC252B00]|nr:hypothetical protein X743_33515 [Mesorhizobium sp. LNHC252B00]